MKKSEIRENLKDLHPCSTKFKPVAKLYGDFRVSVSSQALMVSILKRKGKKYPTGSDSNFEF